jgi:hypothetical protein
VLVSTFQESERRNQLALQRLRDHLETSLYVLAKTKDSTDLAQAAVEQLVCSCFTSILRTSGSLWLCHTTYSSKPHRYPESQSFVTFFVASLVCG